jgi:hypothetical protein
MDKSTKDKSLTTRGIILLVLQKKNSRDNKLEHYYDSYCVINKANYFTLTTPTLLQVGFASVKWLVLLN